MSNDEIKQKWLVEKDDGNIVVTTKDGVFEFTDIPYDKIMSAKKRSTRQHNDGSASVDTDMFELMLISDSLVKPKMGEMDLKALKGSSVMKLRAGIYKLYDMNSFLSM